MENFKFEEFTKSKLFSDLKIEIEEKIKIENLLKFFNKKIIRDNFITIRNFIIYKVPGDWSERLKNIKTKFNRDSSSLNSYIERFGEEIGKEKFIDKTKKTTVTLEYLIEKNGISKGQKMYDKICKKKKSVGKKIMQKKYGEILGTEKWEEYLKKWKKGIKERKEQGNWKNGLSLEECIYKYGEIEGNIIWENRRRHLKYISSEQYFLDNFGQNIGEKKWIEYCKKRDYTSLKYFVKKYGDIEGQKKYKERCKLISYYGSEEYYIKKYGEVEGKRRKKEAINKSFLNHKFKITRYSKISQELFWEIYNKLNEEQKKICYFAELNNEYVFYAHTEKIKIFFTDFKIGNKIIEFNGDYWHSLEKVKKRDEIKKEYLINKNYLILEISENYYLNNKNEVIEKAIQFIINN